MKPDRDRPIVYIAVLSSLMLLLVLTSDRIPPILSSILYTACIMGIFSLLMLRNILREARAIKILRLYATGLAVFFGVLIAIILLEEKFENGDTLVLGMEPGTAIMVFGISLVPFWFIILWVTGFRQAFVPHEREAHLNQLKSENVENEGNTDG